VTACPKCGADNWESALECACGQCLTSVGTDQPAGDPVEQPSPELSGKEAADTRPPTPTPWSLVTLVVVNVAVFALEVLWGGSESTLTLYRMGAGLGRAALLPEPWRVVSSAFLHIGVFHLLLNMWALLAFGQMLEAALGARRFIVLYALCAAAGGLTSSLIHRETLAAGASGAVWGLMTGQIALIVRLRREFGAERVPVDTGKLAQPLVVNLLYSLRPGIDMAAHIGGGLAGAGLILSGLISRRQPEGATWRLAAWGASLTMAGSVALALGQGQPWQLRWAPSLVPRAISDTPAVVHIPASLRAWPTSEAQTVGFGDLRSDPLFVACRAGLLGEPIDERHRPEYLVELARTMKTWPLAKGESRDQGPHVVQLRLRPAAFYSTHGQDGLRLQTWVMVQGSWFVRLDVGLRPDAPASWAALPGAIANEIVIYSSRAPIPDEDQESHEDAKHFSRAQIPDEEEKAHEDAKRFARLVVSEIKLYNESKVSEGRKNKDIYERLKEDIERGRQLYHDRVAPQVRDSTHYFYDELVAILAGGDATALGPVPATLLAS